MCDKNIARLNNIEFGNRLSLSANPVKDFYPEYISN